MKTYLESLSIIVNTSWYWPTSLLLPMVKVNWSQPLTYLYVSMLISRQNSRGHMNKYKEQLDFFRFWAASARLFRVCIDRFIRIKWCVAEVCHFGSLSGPPVPSGMNQTEKRYNMTKLKSWKRVVINLDLAKVVHYKLDECTKGKNRKAIQTSTQTICSYRQGIRYNVIIN